jgi:peptide/nickel transport system substrate-binding protein
MESTTVNQAKQNQTSDGSSPAVRRRISRTQFLHASVGLAGLSLLLAACSQGGTAAPTVAPVATAVVPPTVAPQNAGQQVVGAVPTTAAAAPVAATPTTAAAAASAATPTASAANATAGQTKEVKVAYGVEQFPSGSGLDPQVHLGTIDESRLRNIYECLVAFRPDLRTIEPQLATSWKRIDDLTMQFKLREGVKFHNGDVFDAAAVKYSIENILQAAVAAQGRTSYLSFKQVDIIDSNTVNIVTQKPDPLFLARLSGFTMTMVDPKWVNSTTKDRPAFAKAANGTGPYRLVDWQGPNKDLVLEANPDWWGGPLSVKSARFKVITEQASRAAALLSGDADVAQAMPPEQIAHINANSGKTDARIAISNRIPFYFFDVSTFDPIFDQSDPKSYLRRQAVNYAANIDGIIKSVLIGEGSRVSTILGPWIVGNSSKVKPYPYDVQKAKDLLAQAGNPNGIETSIYFIQGRYVKDAEVAQAIAQELGKANIKVKPVLSDPTQQNNLDNTSKLNGLVFASWGNWMFDADNSFYPLFHSSAAKLYNGGKGGSARTWINADFDAAVDAGRYELDPDKRQAYYDTAQQIMYDQAPALYMYQLHDIYGVNSQIDWPVRSDEMIWFKEMKWKS